MVVLSPKFTILASMSVVAVMTMLPTADAIAINKSGKGANVQPGHGVNGGTSTSPNAKGIDAMPSDSIPTGGVTELPFPAAGQASEGNGASSHRWAERYWTHDQKLNAVSKWWLTGNSLGRRSPEPHIHHEKIVVSRDDDHVHLRRRSPSPSPRRHHHHHQDDYDHHHDKVIVSGDHDRVNMRRSHVLQRKHRHHFHGHRRDTFTSVGDGGVVLVSSSPGKSDRNRDDGKANKKRDTTPFSEQKGVPGRIDVMSTVAGSPQGQFIASLVVDLVQGNDTDSSTPQLVLDASQTDQTELYLVALSDCISLSLPDNSTDPVDPSSVSGSSASSSSIASFDVNSPPSNGTAPSNSSAPSCSAPSGHKRVVLTVPVFDPQNVNMTTYCATFDPRPLAPSPLTVEPCAAGATTAGHKSQVFDYDSSTGVIQPLWNGNGPTGDDDSSDGAHNSVESPTVPDASDSPMDTDETMTRIADLSNKLVSGHAMSTRSLLARSPYSDAQNVTLVFAPTLVIVAPTNSSSSSSMTSSTLSASSVVSSSTLSGTTSSISEHTTVFATFSPAAAPTSSSSDLGVSSDFASTTVVFSPAEATSLFSGSSIMSASSTDLSSAAATSTAAAHSLGVEVFDPDAMSTSSTVTDGSNETSTNSPTPVVVGSSSGPSDPTMTPVSTASAPYEWMFRSVKNRRS